MCNEKQQKTVMTQHNVEVVQMRANLQTITNERMQNIVKNS